MAVIDAFSYNGEAETLYLHIASLAPHVDRFFITESSLTFSGNRKPLHFPQDKNLVDKWKDKITYFVVNDNDLELWNLAEHSPNTIGAHHWKREFVQKESIKYALQYLEDDDRVYTGDVDEIWDPKYKPVNEIEKLKLRVYAYYYDNRSTEEFWGPITGKWKDIKGKCLNHLRSDVSLRNSEYAGWHFTSMGGFVAFKKKLEDSYTSESYLTPMVLSNLSERHANAKDFLGRDFKFETDPSEWPFFLKKNRKEFAHLCRGVAVKTRRK